MGWAINLDLIMAYLAGLMLPMARVGAFLMALPVLSTTIGSPMIRVFLTIIVTLVVASTLPEWPMIQSLNWRMVLVLINQLLIGFAMGLSIRLVMGGVHVAGQIIGQQMGLGFASLQDPLNGAQVPHVSRFYSLFVTLGLLAVNAHILVLQLIVDSFVLLPLDVQTWDGDLAGVLAQWGSRVFTGAAAIALPAMMVLLLVNIAFGVITKAAPQLNIFVVGFPMTLAVGFMLMLITLPNVLPMVVMQFDEMLLLIRQQLASL